MRSLTDTVVRELNCYVLTGTRGHPLQAGYATDGIQRDVTSADAIVPSHQRVTEFMQYDAAEDGEDEDYRRKSSSPTASIRYCGHQYPHRQDPEGPVNVNAYSGETTKFPLH